MEFQLNGVFFSDIIQVICNGIYAIGAINHRYKLQITRCSPVEASSFGIERSFEIVKKPILILCRISRRPESIPNIIFFISGSKDGGFINFGRFIHFKFAT
ncbi:hypothetical protein SDC9_160337 [bioreactor metagenome]|uniref:Uncharacterized protein n=1 Tax=bioreactor metagenome TaxID=1076179 RepID=A0A645FFC4_9ZZZZ